MKFLPVAARLAAAVLGMPAAGPLSTWIGVGLNARNAGYQGDGFYLAQLNTDGVAGVEFTSTSDLKLTARGLDAGSLVRDELQKRDGVMCSGIGGNTSVMDPANRQLASKAAKHGYYNSGSCVRVFSGNYVSYFCVYSGQALRYDLIIAKRTQVSQTCVQSGYGFVHDNNNNRGDLAVGRTYASDHFYASGFHG